MDPVKVPWNDAACKNKILQKSLWFGMGNAEAAKGIMVEQYPGMVLIIPLGVIYAVQNIEDSVALTPNFVDSYTASIPTPILQNYCWRLHGSNRTLFTSNEVVEFKKTK